MSHLEVWSPEWDSAKQIQTKVAILQEPKYFCVISSTCERTDPKIGLLFSFFWVFRISFNLLISKMPCIFLMPCIFYSSLPESAKLITVWENGNRDTDETWTRTLVWESGAYVAQNSLKSSVFQKNSIPCSSWNNSEIPESWDSKEISHTACPTQKGYKTQSSNHVSQCLVWEVRFPYKGKCHIPKRNLWTGWHHWKSEITWGRRLV